MQTPPPFHGYEGTPPPAPKKKNNTVLIVFAVLGALLLCCGVPIGFIAFYGMKFGKGAMSMVGCMANVSIMQNALREYEQAHDGKLPSADKWQTELGKYMKTAKADKDMPMKIWKDGGEWACEDNGVKTGFMFNEALSEKKASDVLKANPDAIAIFETKTVSFNQAGPFVKLPHEESPKVMGEILNERRGWFMIDVEGKFLYVIDKKGKRVPFNMSNGSNGSGFNFNMDSNESSNSKDDNSN